MVAFEWQLLLGLGCWLLGSSKDGTAMNYVHYVGRHGVFHPHVNAHHLEQISAVCMLPMIHALYIVT